MTNRNSKADSGTSASIEQNPMLGEGSQQKEYILCAANFYQDNKTHGHQPKNISTGFVVSGRRHHNCIQTFGLIVGFPYSKEALEIRRTELQGFLTNKDRFLNRKDAYIVAHDANQIKGPNKGRAWNSIGLTSEDLY